MQIEFYSLEVIVFGLVLNVSIKYAHKRHLVIINLMLSVKSGEPHAQYQINLE